MEQQPPRTGWFDEANGVTRLSEYFQRMESWQQAIADGKITPEEIRDQSSRVIALLKEVEPLVSEPEHQLITETLYEIAVLQAMQASAVASSLRTSQ
ncbi:hypothetical protein [Gloeobacter kilaueensis]|uniref:Uncharacterized protein n=1 Tax=Gloeobacter kilaueensis (strain ATCC BAA-2537 / CCAP 1431/1 / ULC 316 / JS1) TaxID=1183438 RepID=U5QJY5_GLOK1|nr:hypothetical protein [Gloeobacter kilaueensis]AGY59236.1 hypothetical protein GKIL_2990 [Gloeobacter kilaueensis JS1]